jgi:hypothetical protein
LTSPVCNFRSKLTGLLFELGLDRQGMVKLPFS